MSSPGKCLGVKVELKLRTRVFIYCKSTSKFVSLHSLPIITRVSCGCIEKH